VALSGDGRRALSGSDDGSLRWWDLDSGACLHALRGHAGGVSAVALSGDGRRALSGSADESLRWWDLEGGACLHELVGHAGRVSAVALSGDGRCALSASDDYSLRWWDLTTGRCLAVFPCEGPVIAVALFTGPASSPATVAAGLKDGQVQFFHIERP
jgi:WD40 repeat protein